MCHTLKPIVDIQLRRHIDETKSVDHTNERVEHEGVVAFVVQVGEGVVAVTHDEWVRDFEEQGCCYFIVFLDTIINVMLRISNLNPWKVTYRRNLTRFFYLPELQKVPKLIESTHDDLKDNQRVFIF